MARDQSGPAPGPAGAASPVLRLTGLTKSFQGTLAVDGLSLDAADGELVTVVGPSGCGKSTLLRLISGLTHPDGGRVAIGGVEVAGPQAWVPAERRGVGVVFQDHALFPHLTVAGNVAFGLAGPPLRGRRGTRARDRDGRVREVLELVGLESMGARYPHELSGGEQQRVALARALAPRPALILLDEPFSNLDRNLRVRVREDTAAVLRAAAVTGVFVTHDQEEAMALGDRVAVVRAGRVDQVAAPGAVFHAPATRFVATFMGEADFVPGRRYGSTAATRLGDVPVTGAAAGDVDVMVRPHEVSFDPDPSGDAVVRGAEFRGAFIAYRLDLGDGSTLRSLRPHVEQVEPGTRVAVHLAPGHPLAAFPAGPAGSSA